MIVAPLSARIVERVGTKRVVTTGLLIISVALLALSFLQTDTPYPVAISGFCVMAVGMGMTMAPATESVMGSLPREKAGVGSAVNDTTRQVGGALGVAVIGSVVSSIYASNVDERRQPASASPAATSRRRGRRSAGHSRSAPRRSRIRRRGQGRLRRRPEQRAAPQLADHPRRRVRRLALPPGAGRDPLAVDARRPRRSPWRRQALMVAAVARRSAARRGRHGAPTPTRRSSPRRSSS